MRVISCNSYAPQGHLLLIHSQHQNPTLDDMNTASCLKLAKIAFFASYLLVLMACNSESSAQKTPEQSAKEVPVENTTKSSNKTENLLVSEAESSLLYSFAFVGCNRLERQDVSWNKKNGNIDPSSANTAALKKIFGDVLQRDTSPDAFLMLGDLVTGEKSTSVLDAQLSAWVDLYRDKKFSDISMSDIEFVAVPGNHEMLTYGDEREFPLDGATQSWARHMNPLMPKDRSVAGSGIDQLSFSFIRGNIGFVVMNTDTYDAQGVEGETPTKWIEEAIANFENNAEIAHIFVIGHKPHYAFDSQGNPAPQTGHSGFNDGGKVWAAMQKSSKTIAMLSAHIHDYQRMQPDENGPHQVVAGQAGSKGFSPFFGYSRINVYNDGSVELKTYGYDVPTPYNAASSASMTERDTALLTRSKVG